MTHLPDVVDAVEDRRAYLAESHKKLPEIRSRTLIRIIDYVQRLENLICWIDPRNWAWE